MPLRSGGWCPHVQLPVREAWCQVPSRQCSLFSRFRWGTEGLASQAVGAGAPRAQIRGPGQVVWSWGVVAAAVSCWAMLRWLQDFLLPSQACQDDNNRLVYEILFEDLDRNGDGVVDILELREGLKHWSSSFGIDPEKVSH